MTTTVQNAALWNGGGFEVGETGDIPTWLAHALGASKMTFTGIAPNMTVTVDTGSGTQTANPGDYVYFGGGALGATDATTFGDSFVVAE